MNRREFAAGSMAAVVATPTRAQARVNLPA
jgi:hypothetical protein